MRLLFENVSMTRPDHKEEVTRREEIFTKILINLHAVRVITVYTVSEQTDDF